LPTIDANAHDDPRTFRRSTIASSSSRTMTTPAEQSPLAAFLEWHAAEPDAVAIESLGEHDGAGAKQDDVVGIQVELESELYVAFMACWMAGK
jgi:hypothetical protein